MTKKQRSEVREISTSASLHKLKDFSLAVFSEVLNSMLIFHFELESLDILHLARVRLVSTRHAARIAA